MTAPPQHSRFVLIWMICSAAVLSASLGAGIGLTWLLPPSLFPNLRFPPIFLVSTATLWLGSVALMRALAAVRRERQKLFRQHLHRALGWGCLFVALQVVALNWLLQRQNAAEVQTGETAFVSIAAALHGLHFVVAIWFLLFIVLQAHRDRYDHEYYWGVSVCAWFWHALGIIWLAVLGVIAFSSMPAEGPRPTWDRNVIRTLDG